MLQWLQHHIRFLSKVSHTYLGEHFGDAFINFPVTLRFPCRVDRRGQRVNKRMHIRSIHVVFFIPGSGWQNDIGEQTGAGHTEIERDQQIELALYRRGLPFNLFRFNTLT